MAAGLLIQSADVVPIGSPPSQGTGPSSASCSAAAAVSTVVDLQPELDLTGPRYTIMLRDTGYDGLRPG